MSKIKYTPADYRNLLRMTNHKHLLVEGPDDVRFFKLMFDHLFPTQRLPIDIDNAENLIQVSQAFGNREKVEEICYSIRGEPFEKKFVGFVDREFREFDFQPILIDSLDGHRISGRLIWSRGHSVENYFFDFSLLRSPLRDLGMSSNFDTALMLFEQNFESSIRFACAAGLAGRELDRISQIRGSIEWELFDLAESDFLINLDKWRRKLLRSSDSLSVDAIITSFQKWYAIVRYIDFTIVRWLCHGHIGFKTVWEVYSRCVYEVSTSSTLRESHAEAQNSLLANEHLRFNSCTSVFCREAKTSRITFPTEVFTLLELSF